MDDLVNAMLLITDGVVTVRVLPLVVAWVLSISSFPLLYVLITNYDDYLVYVGFLTKPILICNDEL